MAAPKKYKPTDAFLEKLTQIIRDNFSNEQFGVQALADQCGITRAHLYKKIKKFTGKSASQFIREVRLYVALEQLKSGKHTVADVAFNVGFSSHAYFTTCFKDYFGYSPSEVKDRPEIESILKNKQVRKAKNKFKSVPNWVLVSSAVLMLILAGLFVSRTLSEPLEIKDKTIAVIRFDNMTSDENVTDFADGLGEEIINSLSKIDQLKVTARNSSFVFNKNDDIKKIKKVLNVNYLLEGSVRINNNKYRITVQLIDAGDGFHIWSETYDRDPTDILFLQEEIARIVANKFQIQLSKNEDKALASRITQDSLAYAYYNESINTEHSNKSFERQKSIELMNKAIEIDSNFAEAHARIVSLYRWSGYINETEYNDAIKIMQFHVDKALELAPNLAESYIAQGQLKVLKNDFESALNSFNKAIELAPNDPRAHFALSYVLRYFNKTKEGYNAWLKAFETDPLKPQYSIMVGQYYYFKKKDFERGQTILRNFLEVDPDKGQHAYHLEMYRASLPEGDGVGAFKNYYKLQQQNPDGATQLNWLVISCFWLDLMPMSDMLINKIRLLYPDRIPTFWHLYTNNAMQGKYAENIDLVKYWSENFKLNEKEYANYMAESYINSNRPELAKQVIEDSIPEIFDLDFLNNAETFDMLLINRLDVTEKYIIALRELGLKKEADIFASRVVAYIDAELEGLHKDDISDYRDELQKLLMRAAVIDDVDACIKVWSKAIFEDNHIMHQYDRLLVYARFHRFKKLPKFQAFQKRFKNKIHKQRTEVIQFLKEEGVWQPGWDNRL